jgi:hypothetical protein
MKYFSQQGSQFIHWTSTLSILRLIKRKGNKLRMVCSCPENVLCSFFNFNLCHFLFVYFSLLYCIFYILRNLFMCFLSLAGNLSWYFQEFQVVSRVTFARNSLHARLHSRWHNFIVHRIIYISIFVTCYLHWIFKSLSASVTRADHSAS